MIASEVDSEEEDTEEKEDVAASQESVTDDGSIVDSLKPPDDHDTEDSSITCTAAQDVTTVRKSRRPRAQNADAGGAQTSEVGKEIVKYFQSRSKEKSEDELFLDSLKPMLARVSAENKFECKMQIMRVIHSYEKPSTVTFNKPATATCYRYPAATFSSYWAPPAEACSLTYIPPSSATGLAPPSGETPAYSFVAEVLDAGYTGNRGDVSQ